MTDRLATDLSYGHPGKASYDVEGNTWSFSNNRENVQRFRQLSSFKQCLPPSTKVLPPRGTDEVGNQPREKLKKLRKDFPELFPSNEISTFLLQSGSLAKPDSSANTGRILAIGHASAAGHGSKILAIPYGEAGHVLRLIQFRQIYLGWTMVGGPRVAQYNLDLSKQGYWMSTGGTIRQILACEDTSGFHPWLIVRQDTLITILLPVVGKVRPAVVPTTSARKFPASRLSANPIATLGAEANDKQNYMDVSFNPWYSRQFIVVNDHGTWSIWGIVGNTPTVDSGRGLLKNKNGCITDGEPVDPLSTAAPVDLGYGWHRALWVSNINTIIICSRSSIVLFDIKATPVRLPGIEFAAEKSERILDIERSVEDRSRLIVLTTARILWVDVTGSDGKKGMRSGARAVLYCRHFRDPTDTSLKLVKVHDDPDAFAISSSRTSILQIYGFSITPDTMGPNLWQRSFALSTEVKGKTTPDQAISTLLLESTPSYAGSDSEFQEFQSGVRFVQAWALSDDLTLASSLCIVQLQSMNRQTFSKDWKTAPTFMLHGKKGQVISERYVRDASVDSQNSVEGPSHWRERRKFQKDQMSISQFKDLNLRIDWRDIFSFVFPEANPKTSRNLQSIARQDEGATMIGLLETLQEFFQQRKSESGIAMTTLRNISGCTNFTDELDNATSALHDFLKSYSAKVEAGDELRFTTSTLDVSPTVRFTADPDKSASLPGFIGIYDYLVETWLASLPDEVTARSRMEKHKLIRQTAIDIGLSSIGVSLLKAPSMIKALVEDQDADYNPSGSIPDRNVNSTFFSPEMTPESSFEPQMSLPTPKRTPSLYSQATYTSASEALEYPAITRLRRYAISIQSQPDAGSELLLSEWELGADPSKYSWRSLSKASTEETGTEGGRKKRRDTSHRRRLTETYLSSQISRTRAPLMLTSPMTIASGSQPQISRNPFSNPSSSQPIQSLPMTQPDRGNYGSRADLTGGKKKPKARNAGF